MAKCKWIILWYSHLHAVNAATILKRSTLLFTLIQVFIMFASRCIQLLTGKWVFLLFFVFYVHASLPPICKLLPALFKCTEVTICPKLSEGCRSQSAINTPTEVLIPNELSENAPKTGIIPVYPMSKSSFWIRPNCDYPSKIRFLHNLHQILNFTAFWIIRKNIRIWKMQQWLDILGRPVIRSLGTSLFAVSTKIGNRGKAAGQTV